MYLHSKHGFECSTFTCSESSSTVVGESYMNEMDGLRLRTGESVVVFAVLMQNVCFSEMQMTERSKNNITLNFSQLRIFFFIFLVTFFFTFSVEIYNINKLNCLARTYSYLKWSALEILIIKFPSATSFLKQCFKWFI